MSQEPLKGMLAGTVEVDETYVGGKPRKHNGVKAKPGRGTKKVPVVALVERNGRVRAKPIERVDAKTLKGAIRENVDEFLFRWNLRQAADGERAVAASRCAEGKRLTYKMPISK